MRRWVAGRHHVARDCCSWSVIAHFPGFTRGLSGPRNGRNTRFSDHPNEQRSKSDQQIVNRVCAVGEAVTIQPHGFGQGEPKICQRRAVGTM